MNKIFLAISAFIACPKISTVLAVFGYIKIPKEAITLAIFNENIWEEIRKQHDSVKTKSAHDAAKSLTKFLRSGRLFL